MKSVVLGAIVLAGVALAIAGEAPQVKTTESGVKMVLVPGGSFVMGSKKGQADERHEHQVQITQFYMDQTEVTQAHFSKIMNGTNPARWKKPKNPVEQVRWSDAVLYCNARSDFEGLDPCYDEETWEYDFEADGYRLPTEAEWEYACRAGAKTKYSFGNSTGKLKIYAWFKGNSSKKPQAVAQKKPSAWGLYDLHGNVYEWCNDFYSRDYYRTSPKVDPRGPDSGEKRVLRGGSWATGAETCVSSFRFNDSPGTDDVCFDQDIYGFRCVRRVGEEE